jgi:O-antigen/teichoic acid export membrane protein
MLSYLKKGGIAVIDQILFSGSNFLLNIFLVKLLTTADYGLFGSLYSVYLLTCISFIAIFLEPYIYYKNTLKDTLHYTKLHAGLANALLLLSILFSISGFLVQEYLLVYVAYTLSTCVIYFYKRHFVSILAPKYSLFISLYYFILVSAGLLCLNYLIEKTIFNAFLVLNIASILSVLPSILSNTQFKTILYKSKTIIEFSEILKNQKKYSFHCFSSGILSWIPNNIYFILLPLFYSRETNAFFKALQNINLPITHLNIAIVSLLVPIFMKSDKPDKLIKSISILFTLLPLVYLSGILLSLKHIEHFIYNDKYNLTPLIVTTFLLAIIPEIIANIYKAYFRSIEKPELVTKINLGNAIIAIFCSYFVYHYGITGVLTSYIVVNTFNLISSLYAYTNESRKYQKMAVK